MLVLRLRWLDRIVKTCKLVSFVTRPWLNFRCILLSFYRFLSQGTFACIMLITKSWGRGRELMTTVLNILGWVLILNPLLDCRSNSLHLWHIGNYFQVLSLVVLKSSLIQVTGWLINRWLGMVKVSPQVLLWNIWLSFISTSTNIFATTGILQGWRHLLFLIWWALVIPGSLYIEFLAILATLVKVILLLEACLCSHFVYSHWKIWLLVQRGMPVRQRLWQLVWWWWVTSAANVTFHLVFRISLLLRWVVLTKDEHWVHLSFIFYRLSNLNSWCILVINALIGRNIRL